MAKNLIKDSAQAALMDALRAFGWSVSSEAMERIAEYEGDLAAAIANVLNIDLKKVPPQHQ